MRIIVILVLLLCFKFGVCQNNILLFDTTKINYYKINYSDSNTCLFYYIIDRNNTFCSECFNKKGRRNSLENLNEDERNGIFITWFENGQIQLVENYIMGNLSGTAVRYYENGQIEEIGDYYVEKNDSLIYLNWYLDEKKFVDPKTNVNYSSTGLSNKALKDGEWKYFFSNGTLKITEFWNKGKLIPKK